MNSIQIQLKNPALFRKIIFLILIDAMAVLLSHVFLHDYFLVGYVLILFYNLGFISTLRSLEIKDDVLAFTNIYGSKVYSINDLKSLELRHRTNKSGLTHLKFNFNRGKIFIEFSSFQLKKIEEIISYLSESNIPVKINSYSEEHKHLKKYEKL